MHPRRLIPVLLNARRARAAVLTGAAALDNGDGTITITATTSGDISAGVFGVEYSINSVPPPYDFSVNVPGEAASQSITLGPGEGIVAGDTVYMRAYYNIDPLDPVDSRVYGTPTLTVLVGFDGLLIGQL